MVRDIDMALSDSERGGLPAWTYFSQELLELERRELFRKCWQLACHVNDVCEPGDYQCLDMVGERALIVPVHGLDALADLGPAHGGVLGALDGAAERRQVPGVQDDQHADQGDQREQRAADDHVTVRFFLGRAAGGLGHGVVVFK